MIAVGANYRSTKLTNTFSIENGGCEVEITPVIPHDSNEVYTWDFRIRKEAAKYKHKYSLHIEADSKGEASIKVLCDVIKSIDGLPYKAVSIFFESEYVVKMYHEIFSRNGMKKINASPNKEVLLELKSLAETIGQKYYISVKTKKVLAHFGKGHIT